MYLVTGSSGFIGSHLVERLVAQGGRVRCLVRRSSSLRYLPVSAVDLAYGDLATGCGLEEAVRGVETVFHVAGVTKATSPEMYYVGNTQATANMARTAMNAGVRRFVHVSSIAAAGPSPDGVLLLEDAPACPISHYGRSKLEGEKILRNSPLAAQTVLLRPSAVYGPRDTDLYKFFRAVSRGRLPRIGSRERWFNLIYVKDLVEGMCVAASAPAVGGRTFFLAHPEPVSWTQLGTTAAALMGRRVRMVCIPRAPALALGLCVEWWSRLTRSPNILSRDQIREASCNWTCDSNRARHEIGFSSTTSLGDGLSQTLAWYRDAGWLRY